MLNREREPRRARDVLAETNLKLLEMFQESQTELHKAELEARIQESRARSHQAALGEVEREVRAIVANATDEPDVEDAMRNTLRALKKLINGDDDE